MLYVCVLVVGKFGSPMIWDRANGAAGIHTGPRRFIRGRVDSDHGKCTLARQPHQWSRSGMYVPSQSKNYDLQLKCFVRSFVFHNKKFKLIHFFLQKGKLLQKNPVILSVLVFLPTRSILNYSVFCMLIFCKNQCRCSLSAERSHYVELLSVITKI